MISIVIDVFMIDFICEYLSLKVAFEQDEMPEFFFSAS